jgi:integrase/recombinase XerC
MNTLADLADLYLTERVRHGTLDPMTARNYRSSLTQCAGQIETPSKLDAGAIEAWLGSRGHLSAATRRGDLTAVTGFCRWLVRRGVLAVDPSVDVAPVRCPDPVPRALEPGQVAAVLRHCPDLRARAIVWLQVGEGLRCGEVSRLRVADWSRSAGTIMVRGKGARERVLPVTGDVARALDCYLGEHPCWSGPLVRSYRRPWAALAPDTISGMVSEWMRAAGVKGWARDGISAHALRHTAASDVLDHSKDLRAVQEMLGHRHLQTTAVYLRRANLDRLRDAMAGRRYLVA